MHCTLWSLKMINGLPHSAHECLEKFLHIQSNPTQPWLFWSDAQILKGELNVPLPWHWWSGTTVVAAGSQIRAVEKHGRASWGFVSSQVPEKFWVVRLVCVQLGGFDMGEFCPWTLIPGFQRTVLFSSPFFVVSIFWGSVLILNFN